MFRCLHLRHARFGEPCCATIIRHTSTYKWLPSITSFTHKSANTFLSPHYHDLSAAFILICCCVDTTTQFVHASPIGHAWRIYIYILDVPCFDGEVCIGDIDTCMRVNNDNWELFNCQIDCLGISSIVLKPSPATNQPILRGNSYLAKTTLDRQLPVVAGQWKSCWIRSDDGAVCVVCR